MDEWHQLALLNEAVGALPVEEITVVTTWSFKAGSDNVVFRTDIIDSSAGELIEWSELHTPLTQLKLISDLAVTLQTLRKAARLTNPF